MPSSPRGFPSCASGKEVVLVSLCLPTRGTANTYAGAARAPPGSPAGARAARATPDTGSWARVEVGLLGRVQRAPRRTRGVERARRGGPAGPVQLALRQT